MSLIMCEKDKNSMLDSLLPENETYNAKLWGVIKANTKSVKSMAMLKDESNLQTSGFIGGKLSGPIKSLRNQYCYIGLTDKRIIFCAVETFDCSKIKAVYDIELSNITNVKSKFNLMPGRKVLQLSFEGGNIKLLIMKNAIGSDIQGQNENLEVLINTIYKL